MFDVFLADCKELLRRNKSERIAKTATPPAGFKAVEHDSMNYAIINKSDRGPVMAGSGQETFTEGIDAN